MRGGSHTKGPTGPGSGLSGDGQPGGDRQGQGQEQESSRQCSLSSGLKSQQQEASNPTLLYDKNRGDKRKSVGRPVCNLVPTEMHSTANCLGLICPFNPSRRDARPSIHGKRGLKGKLSTETQKVINYKGKRHRQDKWNPCTLEGCPPQLECFCLLPVAEGRAHEGRAVKQAQAGL